MTSGVAPESYTSRASVARRGNVDATNCLRRFRATIAIDDPRNRAESNGAYSKVQPERVSCRAMDAMKQTALVLLLCVCVNARGSIAAAQPHWPLHAVIRVWIEEPAPAGTPPGADQLAVKAMQTW